MSERLSIVIPKALNEDLESLQDLLQVDKSTLVRMLLSRSIRELCVEHAIKAYTQGKVSFGKASGSAGLTLWEWMDELRREGVGMDFSLDDARDELARWRAARSTRDRVS